MTKKAKKAVRSAKSKPKKKVSKAAARAGGKRNTKQIAPVEKPPALPPSAAPVTSTATASAAAPGLPEPVSTPAPVVPGPSPEKQWIDNVTQPQLTAPAPSLHPAENQQQEAANPHAGLNPSYANDAGSPD